MSKAKGSLKENERMKDDIAAMKQQIRALSEHVDNLTYRVIKIEEGLKKLASRQLTTSPTPRRPR